MPSALIAPLNKAFAKAAVSGGAEAVTFDTEKRIFYVPSGTNPTKGYTLAPRQGEWDTWGRKHPNGLPWFDALICSCPAQDAGFVICWHKAAVKLWTELHGVPPEYGL